MIAKVCMRFLSSAGRLNSGDCLMGAPVSFQIVSSIQYDEREP